MNLEQQIADNARQVQTQSYSMSVSEMVSMYRDGELGLHPEFQRFFRWTPEQKSRFVESLLLGIPVPPVFVSERPDSKWDVIDGLQRLSTILELMGELRSENGDTLQPLVLSRTTYLPGLEGKLWLDVDGDRELPENAKIKLKRARLDVNIVRSSSDEDVKYEVFQRLNTGGASATDQEVRNCLLVMANRDYFNWLKALSEKESFRETLALTDRAIDEAFDMELVSRYVVFSAKPPDELQKMDELGAYLSRESIAQARDSAFPFELVEQSFSKVFEFLANVLRSDAFRRFDMPKERYAGPMLVSLFEVVAIGLGYRVQSGAMLPQEEVFAGRHRELWAELGRKTFVGSGVRASTRVPETVRFGREWVSR